MPHPILINNLSRGIPKPQKAVFCDSFLCRLRGLMFRSGLEAEDGLLLVQAKDSRIDSSIHMFFVPFDLAVFWINSEHVVVDRVIAKPWRPAYLSSVPARYILEVHPQHWDEFQIGDRVEFVDA